MNNTDWTQEKISELREAESNMDNVLSNPSSTYTEMCEAIDNFFDTW